MNESIDFSEYDKQNNRHQPRRRCDFCKEHVIESWTKQLTLTSDWICEDCIKAMTLEQAVRYVKGQEMVAEGWALMELIRQLYPEHISKKNINNE